MVLWGSMGCGARGACCRRRCVAGPNLRGSPALTTLPPPAAASPALPPFTAATCRPGQEDDWHRCCGPGKGQRRVAGAGVAGKLQGRVFLCKRSVMGSCQARTRCAMRCCYALSHSKCDGFNSTPSALHLHLCCSACWKRAASAACCSQPSRGWRPSCGPAPSLVGTVGQYCGLHGLACTRMV